MKANGVLRVMNRLGSAIFDPAEHEATLAAVDELGDYSKVKTHQNQRRNWGPDLVPISEAEAAVNLNATEAAVNLSTTKGALTRTGRKTVREDPNYAALFKKQNKKKKRAHPVVAAHGVDDFFAFGESVLGNTANIARLKKAQEEEGKLGCMSLRSMLMNQTSDRMRWIVFDLIGERLPKTLSKKELMLRVIRVMFEKVNPLSRVSLTEIEPHIADFAVATQTTLDVIKGEVVLLKHNALDFRGVSCVSELDILEGWVVREQCLIDVRVELSSIKWGELVKRKKLTDAF